MDAATLRRALQFGNGNYLNDRSGIGRFGMGLPNSSLSQATRVDVWSWQDGGRPMHSYLDLHEISRSELREVPEPREKRLPGVWTAAATPSAQSGTLVVWSRIDIQRCQWGTARAIINNSEFIIGRVYRRFIAEGRVAIKLVAFNVDNPAELLINRHAQANDPNYLMPVTSCPEPWDKTAMFEPWGEPHEFKVNHAGAMHSVKLSFSIAKTNAREGFNPGSKDHGRHASRNIGVSVMRADRELELQLDWRTSHDPRERWWGAEVEFPPELDELFGVTNNKQSARALAEYARIQSDDLVKREEFESIHELMEAWEESGDPRLILLRIKLAIESNLAAIRRQLQGQTARRQPRHHDPNSAEAKGTEATRKRRAEGYSGDSDASELKPDEEKESEVESGLREFGIGSEEAGVRAKQIVQDGRKYEFVHAPVDGDAFFSVRPKGGVILINLNTEHPAYAHLVALLESGSDAGDGVGSAERLRKSYEGLKLLLEAWARYEDELPAVRKDIARQARADWGRVARQFLSED